METSSTLSCRVRDTGDAPSGRASVTPDPPLIVRYALGRRRGPSEPDAQDVLARLPLALPAFARDRARRGRRCDRGPTDVDDRGRWRGDPGAPPVRRLRVALSKSRPP
jgi:hypothetical protein